MSLAILNIGTAVPAAVDRDEALAVARALCCRSAEQATWLPAMYAQSGIDRRHMIFPRAVVRDAIDGTKHTGSVWLPTGAADDRGPTTRTRMEEYARLAPPLAVEAATRAVASSGVDAPALTHLVTVSCTGFAAPGVDLTLIEALHLSPEVARTHVGFMGCHGALNGLRVARSFTTADPAARVLLVAVELCSLHYHYGWDPSKVIANALFADGAAALVGIHAGAAPADAWRVVANGSCLLPDSAAAMTWTVGDHGFEMTLSKSVPGLIAQHLRPWLEGWLRGQGLALADVASWAVHPGGPRILAAVEESLGLTRQQTAMSWEVLATHGNMSSPTILFILDRLRQQGAARPCVALGFGPGLTAEAALFR